MNTVLVPLRHLCTCFFFILYIQLNQLILDVGTSKVLRHHLAGFFFTNESGPEDYVRGRCMCHIRLLSPEEPSTGVDGRLHSGEVYPQLTAASDLKLGHWTS